MLDWYSMLQVLARRRPTVNVKQLIMEEFERPCCIRGYHIYQEVWTAAVGEELVCERKPHNSHRRYAVAVKRIGTSCEFWLEQSLAMESTPLG